jgi:hypothetical protein
MRFGGSVVLPMVRREQNGRRYATGDHSRAKLSDTKSGLKSAAREKRLTEETSVTFIAGVSCLAGSFGDEANQFPRPGV